MTVNKHGFWKKKEKKKSQFSAQVTNAQMVRSDQVAQQKNPGLPVHPSLFSQGLYNDYATKKKEEEKKKPD